MTMPIPQLVNNFSHPESTAAIAAASVLLGMAGNTLMIPRALFTRDLIWLSGSMWGATLMGWVQLLSIWLAGFLHSGLFATCTVAYFGFLGATLWQDSAFHRVGLWAPLLQVFRTRKQD
jgi:hypothetical protein